MIELIKTKKWIQSCFWVLIIISIWELCSVLGLINNYLVPPFHQVIQEMIVLIKEGKFVGQMFNSLLMIFQGFLISVIVSIIIVFACSLSDIVKSFIRTLCVILTPLPGVAIMPIIIMLFGIQEKAMIVLMLHSVLWPLVTNTLGGIESIPKMFTDFGENIELNPLEMVFEVYFLAIMPCLITGTRIGWGRAWRALISAEMVFGLIGNLGGIGYFIYTNRAYGNMTRVMVGVFVVIIFGVVIESGVFGCIEKYTIRRWGMSNE